MSGVLRYKKSDLVMVANRGVSEKIVDCMRDW